MNKYTQELASLKSWDTVQGIKPVGRGYNFITTAGHGYLVVPKDDMYAHIAENIVNYGFVGQHAYYLEEDCEYSEFIQAVKNYK